MPRGKKTIAPTEAAAVDAYKHSDKRVRIPTQEQSVRLSAREKQPVKKTYKYDPSLDPQLTWSGKEEQGAEFGVSTVPIYVQEKIAPEAIVARLKQRALEDAESIQTTLFGDTAQEQFDKAVDFYKHEDNWQNRMILGDSLLVMNSLLEKEGLRGKVQTIYIDPPYGIKFGSNWQVSTRKRDVKDNKIEDFVRQPEQVKAFRDTWELGIHSYLSYLRDRLLTARELLTESGSCFVQINDENVHLVRNLMDEIFGGNNFVGQIPFVTTSGFASKFIDSVADYIVWYGKNTETLKYRQLYKEKVAGLEGSAGYDFVELANGETRAISEFKNSELPAGSRLFTKGDLLSKGPAGIDQAFEFEGKTYRPNANSHWKAKFPEGMQKLSELGRIVLTGNTLRYKRYFNDFPLFPINNVWSEQLSEQNKDYVVQTATETIKRCLLMSTDPGDLVLDPTCGSGTTAFVAEQWGRRWITTDTSRVALALARTRLMTAKFPYYKLKDTAHKEVKMGFEKLSTSCFMSPCAC
jgi:adenine-specific DNA-methyltransferase